MARRSRPYCRVAPSRRSNPVATPVVTGHYGPLFTPGVRTCLPPRPIEIFCGECGPCARHVLSFLDSVEREMDFRAIPYADWGHHAYNFLQGEAAAWYREKYPDRYPTWPGFVCVFIFKFMRRATPLRQ